MNSLKTNNLFKRILGIITIASLTLTSCSKDDDSISPILSNDKQITSFDFFMSENPIPINIIGNLDEENKTITVVLPGNTSSTALIPDVNISTNATISPNGLQDFDSTVIYTVTAEDDTTIDYKITVISEKDILVALYNANPDSTLDWDLNNDDISTWAGVTTNNSGYISKLHLPNRNLEKLTSEIGLLAHLVELNLSTFMDLSPNKLSSIPKEIGLLKKLTILNLIDNNLVSLPEEIGNLTNLTELHLSYNDLESIPKEIGLLNSLSILYLNGNELTKIPAEIGQLTNLSKLVLTTNNFSSIPQKVCDLENNYNTTLYISEGVTCE